MADYTSTANVVLSVNGKQAQKMLSQLEKQAQSLEKKIAAAAAAGDKATMKKLQRELKSTQRMMEQLKGSSASVEDVLRRLDKATPKELNRTLKTLQQQLNGIQRGTAAWDAQAAKIRAVKAELQKVNATMREQSSLSEKVMNWFNKWQVAILGGVAGITGLVLAGRKAVDAYAEMEQEMANVRKFTGMSAKDVEGLNEEFKKMDTRSSREELNKLAQEAGRLGKSSREDVLGFVRAADKINVALDDLGSGATLTLSKLTGIFGDEERLGTEKALLSVGSAINELSQNCSASAPYIAEFASRMGGVGAQAGLTVQQIMGFAAVLDSNNQKLEASSTALSQVIVRIYQEPQKYARVAGMDARRFSDLVKTDMNAALIEFLSTLKQAGNMDVLSPMFKDMGENGSRAISALSTLANHIAEVKSQQEAANVAFEEATSIDKEFEVQNNTVLAGLEKARKKIAERAIELGEKLAPIMKHVYSTSGIFLRVLSTIVSFLVRNQRAIIVITAAIIAYNVVLKTSTIITNLHYAALVLVEKAQLAWQAVLAVGRGFVIGFQVVVIALTRGLDKARIAFQLLTKSMASNPWGAVAVAVAAATAALVGFLTQSSKGEEAQKRMAAQLAKTNSEIEQEREEIDKLFYKLRSAEQGTTAYQKAKDEILSKYGKYLQGLGEEVEALNNVAEAYRIITMEAENAARARGLAEANKAADDYFNNLLEDEGKNIYKGLSGATRKVRYGNTTKEEKLTKIEITKWMRKIIDEATKRDFSDETKTFLKSIGVYTTKSGEWGGKGDIADALNTIVEGAVELSEEKFTNKLIFGSTATTYDGMSAIQVGRFMYELQEMLNGNYSKGTQGGSVTLPNGNYVRFETNNDIVNEIEQLKILQERLENTEEGVVVVYNKNRPSGNSTLQLSEEDQKKKEADERKKQIKERKEFKEALDAAKGEWEKNDSQNTSDYSNGLKTWSDYLLNKHNLEMKYFEDREAVFTRFYLTEDEEYQALLKRKAEAQSAWIKKQAALKVEEARRMQFTDEADAKMDYYTPGSQLFNKEEALQQRLFEIRIGYLKQMQAAYTQNSEEWHNYQVQIEQEETTEQLRRQKLLSQRIAEWKKKYSYLEASTRYEIELSIIEEAYAKELISHENYLEAKEDLRKKYAEEYLPQSAKEEKNPAKELEKNKARELTVIESLYAQGLLLKEEYEAAKARIERNYRKTMFDEARKFNSKETTMILDLVEAWDDFTKSQEEGSGNWATRFSKLASSAFAIVNAGMEQMSEFMRSSTDAEIAQTEKKYDREIELAEGNSYRVKRAEKMKEKEIARIKNESARKQFAMQVISAVAQTAINALNAYGSAAAVPLIGYILAPIAASMAVAAGMLQVAALKKQQQAAEAQGYSEGGFTPPGRKDEAVGVVHAGEWVASQKLVNNPQTRPLIDALDYAQRTNTIGSLTAADVSRSITAPLVLASAQPQPVVVHQDAPTVIVERDAEYAEILRRLAVRLEEPFVTVNTVTGDHGIQRAQEEYDLLMRNKSPKSRR